MRYSVQRDSALAPATHGAAIRWLYQSKRPPRISSLTMQDYSLFAYRGATNLFRPPDLLA